LSSPQNLLPYRRKKHAGDQDVSAEIVNPDCILCKARAVISSRWRISPAKSPQCPPHRIEHAVAVALTAFAESRHRHKKGAASLRETQTSWRRTGRPEECRAAARSPRFEKAPALLRDGLRGRCPERRRGWRDSPRSSWFRGDYGLKHQNIQVTIIFWGNRSGLNHAQRK